MMVSDYRIRGFSWSHILQIRFKKLLKKIMHEIFTEGIENCKKIIHKILYIIFMHEIFTEGIGNCKKNICITFLSIKFYT